MFATNTARGRTNPIAFHTVVLRQHNDWMRRIRDSLLLSASFIRVLAIDLPFTCDDLSDEELSLIGQLLEISQGIRHFAVVRHIRTLQLESLYLMWDGFFGIPEPPWENQGLYDARAIKSSQPMFSVVVFPVNLDRRLSQPLLLHLRILARPNPRRVMFVIVGPAEKSLDDSDEDSKQMIWAEDQTNANVYTLYLESTELLVEWVAKGEGRRSALEHPPPRTLETAGLSCKINWYIPVHVEFLGSIEPKITRICTVKLMQSLNGPFECKHGNYGSKMKRWTLGSD
ncbi:hypothetical protein B0H13DRAFT_1929365 [Mycena leptocephala]|nr:hypothetical protein B0H13DRAFT_1929365 [Mycena leptocephala]